MKHSKGAIVTLFLGGAVGAVSYSASAAANLAPYQTVLQMVAFGGFILALCGLVAAFTNFQEKAVSAKDRKRL